MAHPGGRDGLNPRTDFDREGRISNAGSEPSALMRVSRWRICPVQPGITALLQRIELRTRHPGLARCDRGVSPAHLQPDLRTSGRFLLNIDFDLAIAVGALAASLAAIETAINQIVECITINLVQVGR